MKIPYLRLDLQVYGLFLLLRLVLHLFSMCFKLNLSAELYPQISRQLLVNSYFPRFPNKPTAGFTGQQSVVRVCASAVEWPGGLGSNG